MKYMYRYFLVLTFFTQRLWAVEPDFHLACRANYTPHFSITVTNGIADFKFNDKANENYGYLEALYAEAKRKLPLIFPTTRFSLDSEVSFAALEGKPNFIFATSRTSFLPGLKGKDLITLDATYADGITTILKVALLQGEKVVDSFSLPVRFALLESIMISSKAEHAGPSGTTEGRDTYLVRLLVSNLDSNQTGRRIPELRKQVSPYDSCIVGK